MKSDAVNSFFYIGIICRINGKLIFCLSFIYFYYCTRPEYRMQKPKKKQHLKREREIRR